MKTKTEISISIGGFEKDRLEEFVRLFHDTIHTVNAKDYSPEQLEAWAPNDIEVYKDHLCTKFENSFVAAAYTKDGVLAGYSTLYKDELDLMYVHKDFQRMGIASALADVVENKAKEQGINKLYTEGSITAKPFFEGRGYKVIKEQSKPVRGKILTNYVMVKDIG